jgi:hypothetical protein
MIDSLKLLIFLLAYVGLMKWVLPWLGVPTCLSGACNAAARGRPTRKPAREKGADPGRSQSGKSAIEG